MPLIDAGNDCLQIRMPREQYANRSQMVAADGRGEFDHQGAILTRPPSGLELFVLKPFSIHRQYQPLDAGRIFDLRNIHRHVDCAHDPVAE
jgi:hypothetical protein